LAELTANLFHKSRKLQACKFFPFSRAFFLRLTIGRDWSVNGERHLLLAGSEGRLVPVSLASVSDSNHDDEENLIPYSVEHAVVTHSDAIGVFTPRQFLHSGRTRIIGQGIDFLAHAVQNFFWQAL